MIEDLERGRCSYEQRAWADAYDALSRVDKTRPLELDDLERLAWSAALTGRDEEYLAALSRLHQACVAAEQRKRGARAAFWIGFYHLTLGTPGSATGWFARAQRLIERDGADCVERGYLLLPTMLRHLAAADEDAAQEAAQQAAEIGERCHDRDLVALARHLQARALLRRGHVAQGIALLDEAMVEATSGELSPLVTGVLYCNVIATCQQIQALDRAREWTRALARWCDEQPQLVTFTAICLVNRCEIMQLGGEWSKASDELQQVCQRASRADPEVFGDACYQRAELLRLRGDFVEAEQAYRLASQNGRDPQPGLALMRLAQGKTDAAVSAMRRVLSTTQPTWQRARFLPAFVEIMLAAGNVDEARNAGSELEDIAQQFGTEILGAMAAHARGAVKLAEGDAQAALEPLRHAFAVWHKVGAPYIAARIRVLCGRALHALGDTEGARLELDAARQVFERLGAGPDRVALGAGHESARSELGLSPRELEVLRLVARGKTNKVIARELCVSERTIDRHVSNIFTKIDVASRAAATAFAYENDLL